MKRIVAYYTIVLGFAILVSWVIMLMSGGIPEGSVELGFHLYSEFSLAVICMIGGIFILISRKMGTETTIAGHAMAVYSTLNAAGYYGQQGNYPIMSIFTALFILSVGCICYLYTVILKSAK